MTAAPVASPSNPSVKFTPLLVPRTIRMTQIITATSANFIEVSRTIERLVEIGVNPALSGNFKPANAKLPATNACPANFCLAFNPRDF